MILKCKKRYREYHVAGLTCDTRMAFSTGNIQRICKYTHSSDNNYSMLGLDSHADISCAGRDAHILTQIEGRSCSVHPFNESYEAMTGVNIVNVLYKYENSDGEQFIFEINQCLDFTESMTHSILCTNQARHAGIIINDVPTICDPNSTQDVQTKDKSLSFPIEMNGPIPYLPISKPTQNDIEYLPRVKLTSDDIEWDPHYIFNDGKDNSYPYLEEDFEISHSIQGLKALEDVVDQHQKSIAAATLSYSGRITPTPTLY